MPESTGSPSPAPRGSSDRGTLRRAPSFAKRPRRGPGSYDRRLSPEERKDEQRRTLVDAAAHVFARDGYAGASVASILEASGLSRGTFYRHFQDLREVFLAVQEDAADVLFERIEAAFRSHTDPRERTRASVRAYLEICEEHGDLSRVLHREVPLSSREYVELRRRNLRRIHRLFQEGLSIALAGGTLRRMPDDLTVYAVIVAVEGVCLRYLEERREHEISEALEPLLRLAFRAFT